MRSARWSRRARVLRLATRGLVVAAAVGLGAHASAAVLDHAAARWRGGVEVVLTWIVRAVPAPASPPPAAPARIEVIPYRAQRRRAVVRPDTPLAPDERLDAVRAAFCPEAAVRLCRAREGCGCVHADPDCVARLEEACTNELFADFEAYSEFVELAPAVLDRCLSGFSDLPTHCELPASIVHGCGWPLRDVAPLGEECANATLLCRGGACVSGHCVTLPESGEPASSEVCRLDDVLVGATCRPAVETGQACVDYAQCSEGRGECEDGRCRDRLAHGASCESSWQCTAGLVCRGGRCARAPTWCDEDTDCGSEQECVRPPSHCVPCRDEGECVGTVRCDDGSRCSGGLDCVDPERDATGRCEPSVCRVSELEAVFQDLR